ncbi:metalloregulator ArsR/SmtB family transcription factor [Actinomycetes bacterium KLBMP 9797]
MHAFDVLGDPARRRILELLADGEQAAGAVSDEIRAEFGISPPAVSQHLRVLRESGFVTVRPDGTRRFYAVRAAPLQEVDIWLERFRRFWSQRLDALATELARGKRERREQCDNGGNTAETPDRRRKTESVSEEHR